MGAMKTERPVSRKTKMPVTLCSLGSEENKKINYSKKGLFLSDFKAYFDVYLYIYRC